MCLFLSRRVRESVFFRLWIPAEVFWWCKALVLAGASRPLHITRGIAVTVRSCTPLLAWQAALPLFFFCCCDKGVPFAVICRFGTPLQRRRFKRPESSFDDHLSKNYCPQLVQLAKETASVRSSHSQLSSLMLFNLFKKLIEQAPTTFIFSSWHLHLHLLQAPSPWRLESYCCWRNSTWRKMLFS